MDLTAAAIATIISTGIATSITLLINTNNRINVLNEQLDSILKISIQYPYLENPDFISTWIENKNSNDEKYLRYDIYCNLVFNYMERFCKYYKFNEKQIQTHVNIKDWIRTHKDCWHNPSTPFENLDGCSPKFKNLINTFLQ